MSLYNKIIDLQKLEAAWDKVRKNKPACGVDNITCEQFDNNRKEELKQLYMELREHTYRPLPVRIVTIYKGEKVREIALYAMRDKVVQQSVTAELNKMYDADFSEQTYAYRNNKSALTAVENLDNRFQSGKYGAILKLDIEKFFDRIQWGIMERILRRKISEEDVLGLIRDNVKTVMLEDTGELVEKRLGIYQGSSISPILSNIYLMDFDLWLSKKDVYFVRYSDDILILGLNKEALIGLLGEVKIRLQQVGLNLNEKKVICADVSEGVDFLGYHLSASGKAIPEKAEQSLKDRLEMMWLTSAELSLDEKLKKAAEIIGGWEQYFREDRREWSIFEYAALMGVGENRKDRFPKLKSLRPDTDNIYRDIMEYLSSVWKQSGDLQLELLEYEQFYRIWEPRQETEISEPVLEQLLTLYRRLIITEDEETLVELMQAYTDCGEYEKAAFWMERKDHFYSEQHMHSRSIIPGHSLHAGSEIIYDKETARKILKHLVGREDVHTSEIFGHGNKRKTEMQALPLTEQKIMEHLAGEQTFGTYVQRPNGTVKFLIIDIDISKSVLLKHDRKSVEFQAYLDQAYLKAQEIKKQLHSFGMPGYIEYSGYRGYHVWVFFTEWIPVRYVNMFTDVLEEKLEDEGDSVISIEFFPNKTRIRQGKFGQSVKIPYGLHLMTGQPSYFLDDAGEQVTEISLFLDGLGKVSLNAVKKVLAENIGFRESTQTKSVDMDLEAFEGISANAMEILTKCSLMRYLCQKSCKTGYLTHFERLSVLYVFGHLGEEGKQFVHLVMSFTLNYQYHITEKFIRKMPEKPISCVKLREQYKKLTAEIGCSCSFKRTKNCYPSPVMHAIARSNDLQDDITLPTSRTVPREKQKQVVNEINIHKKAQDLARKIQEMKRQKRSLDLSIAKVEKELGKLYDDAQIDCLEIEMGMLTRRKTDQGYEWLIEI